MTKLLIVGLGGFLGSVARYGLSGYVQNRFEALFPFGTMAVNILGCLIVGALLYFVEDRPVLGPDMRLFLIVGILGGFTTFSAFGYETLQLLRRQQLELALLNIAGSVVLGLAAVWLGRTALKAAGI